jgi:hypothetical protein
MRVLPLLQALTALCWLRRVLGSEIFCIISSLAPRSFFCIAYLFSFSFVQACLLFFIPSPFLFSLVGCGPLQSLAYSGQEQIASLPFLPSYSFHLEWSFRLGILPLYRTWSSNMHSLLFKIVLLFGLVASLASAAPSRLESTEPAKIQKRGTFKVERVRNFAFRGHNGPKQLIKSYRKFGIPIPAGLLDGIAAAAGLGGATGGAKKGKQGGDATATQAAAAPAAQASGARASGGAARASGGAARASGAAGEGSAAKPTGAAGAASAAGGSRATASAAGARASSGAGGAGTGAGASSGAAKGNGTAGAGKTGLVTATPEPGDVEYLSPVKIGGQTINLDFDSGSSDLWVFNTNLPAAQSTGHTLYDSSKSTSFKALSGSTWQISYGDGSGAAGTVGTDTVDIGGATVTEQAVELATAVSQSFVADTGNNGLVGLAFSKLNTIKPAAQKTFFDNVSPSLAEPVFTADLRKNAVGAYEFGTIDKSKFVGEMAWVPVNTTQGFWQFASNEFAVGDGAPQKSGANIQAIADTGTTLILATPAVVNAYYSQVQGAVNNATVGGVTVPCNAQLPDLKLAVGDSHMATVNGSFINFAQVEPGSNGEFFVSPSGRFAALRTRC